MGSHRVRQLIDDVAQRRTPHQPLQDVEHRARVRSKEQSLAAVEAEIVAEMAGSLARAQQRLEASLHRLAHLDAAHAEAKRSDRPMAAAAFNEERRNALRYQWELEVQLDALGVPKGASARYDEPIPDAKPEA